MPRRILFPCLVLATCLGLGTAAAAEDVALTFGESGLTSLRWNGHDYLHQGAPRVRSVTLERSGLDEDPDKAKQAAPGSTGIRTASYREAAGEDAATVTIDPEAGHVDHAYDWGSVRFAYRGAGSSLELTVTITNRSEETVADFDLRPLGLRFPRSLDVSKYWHRKLALPGDAGVIAAPYGEHKLVVECTTMQPLRLWCSKPSKQHEVGLILKGGQALTEPGAVFFHHLGLPRIPAGETLTIPLVLHFTERDRPDAEVAEAAVAAFRDYHGSPLEWEDRRPIGAIFLGKGKGPENNPRNWFKDQQLDIRTEEGLATLREKMMEHADRCVKECLKTGAQGAVVWDPEGGENPHPITYIGDPRMVRIMAPEMVDIYPEYFAKFTAADLRAGICIRPTQVYFKEDQQKWAHGTGSHGPNRNPLDDDFDDIWPKNLPWYDFYPVVERMSRKIAFAQEHWGCTLFYIDTNGVHHRFGKDGKFRWRLLDVHMWRELQRRHPDVLLIPEFAPAPGQLAYTSVYLQPPHSPPVTRDWWRTLLPRAFSVSYTVNLKKETWDGLRPRLIEGVRGGDSMFFRGWFGDHYNEKIRGLYDEVYAEGAINPWAE